MPNPFLPRCAPIWGFPSHFTIADMAPSYQPDVQTVIENVAAPTTSNAISLGARGIKLNLTFSVKGSTCDVELFKVTGGGDVSVKKWAGVDIYQKLYAGNLEMVDLEGLPFKVRLSNISAGTVSCYVLSTQ